ncbi:type II toxin-antitoxin system RelE/ParE family toxin [Oligoflexia bacterium]|nr:type II toxin-antitoxin system RelE/ParE family toxin [Oligoflexia bacterium]
MRFRFADKALEALYTAGKGREKYPEEVVRAFVRRIQTIQGAKDERDFRALKGLHFEKLKNGKDIYSMRLNKAWRLELTFDKDENGKIVVYSPPIITRFISSDSDSRLLRKGPDRPL